MNATHIYTEKFDTRRKLANAALKAMTQLQGFDNGTINKPYELASSIMYDGRTLIQTIYEDGNVRYNDGFHIVEVDDFCMYVDYTTKAINECGIEYGMISEIEEDEIEELHNFRQFEQRICNIFNYRIEEGESITTGKIGRERYKWYINNDNNYDISLDFDNLPDWFVRYTCSIYQKSTNLWIVVSMDADNFLWVQENCPKDDIKFHLEGVNVKDWSILRNKLTELFNLKK